MARKNSEIDNIDRNIGNKIYQLRLAKGISRQELGEKIGVTHQQCQKYENGLNRVSAGRLALIAKFLNKEVSFFFENIEKPAEQKNTQHQRMCIEVSRNFMKIKSSAHQDAVNTLVKSLANENS